MRRLSKVLFTAALLSLTTLLLAATNEKHPMNTHSEAKPNRPNVIVIMADDMGYGDFSSMNGGLSSTPNLDRLAEDSLRFSQAYSASPVCAPARAGFLTGRYPIRTGCTDLSPINGLNSLSLSEVTIADLFKQSDYRTGIIGKWHCGKEGAYRPEHRGFDEVEAFHPQRKTYWKWTIDDNGEEVEADGRYLSDYINERAVAFIERSDASQPFFLHLAPYAPHRPLQAPQDVVDKYLNSGKGLTEGQATVYAMIEIMDDGIGQLLQKLEEKGLRENTIVIFTSDNGPDDVVVGGLSPERFNCGLRGHKYEVFEGGIRVPFLVSWPEGIEAGEFNDMFQFVDILPTLASACDVEIPEDLELDGVDYLTAWKGQAEAPEVDRFWQWNRYYPVADCNIAMRHGDMKLVYPGREGYREMSPDNVAMVTGKKPYEITPPNRKRAEELGPKTEARLYDIANDPSESNDVLAQHAETAAEMQQRMDDWFEEVSSELDVIIDRRFPDGASLSQNEE